MSNNNEEGTLAQNVERFDKKRIKIEWIRCKDISVLWATAQRPYNEKHARHIAENFDPDMFDTIKVTMANGKGVYHVIDGQHRKTAAEMLWGPEERIPCEVLPAEDPARAAKLFVEINSNRKPLTLVTMFLVRVTAGEEMQVAINKIVKSLGLKVGYNLKDGQVTAVGAMESVYRSYGPDVLALTLKALLETWADDNNALSASLIRGYAAFLAEFKDIADLPRLRTNINRSYTPGNLLAVAQNYREIHGGSIVMAIKLLLITSYNKNKRAGQLASKESK